MCQDKKEQIISLLEGYVDIRRKIAVLHYELEHPAQISSEEMIEALSFAQRNSEGHQSNHISNKTLYIALNYQESAERVNAGAIDEITSRLFPLEREIDRLHHYVALLDRRLAHILRQFYFERLTVEEISTVMHLSTKTLRKLRNEAIDTLVSMYEFASYKQ